MRTLVLSIFVALFTIAPVQAQDIDIGVRGDLNFASFRGDTNQLRTALIGQGGSGDFGRRIGFRVGGLLRFHISEMFAIRPEVIYSQKGATFTGSNSGSINGQVVNVEVETTSRYDYLDVPVLAELRFPVNQEAGTPIEPYFFAGPSLGFVVSSETETEATASSGSVSQTQSETNDDDIESTAVSGVLGLGLSWGFESGGALSLDARYNPGFTSLDSDSEFDVQNDVITVGLSYSFAL